MAFALTIVAVLSAISTLVAWIAAGESLGFAIERVVTALVISCPHALGLAIPLVVAISTTIGAILISASTLIVAANAQLLRRATL